MSKVALNTLPSPYSFELGSDPSLKTTLCEAFDLLGHATVAPTGTDASFGRYSPTLRAEVTTSTTTAPGGTSVAVTSAGDPPPLSEPQATSATVATKPSRPTSHPRRTELAEMRSGAEWGSTLSVLSDTAAPCPPRGPRQNGPPDTIPAMLARRSATLIEALAAVAPGRALREGIDRILQANMGALIVVDDGPDVLAICSGGFLLDAEFSPQRLSELAKMDGAIILAPDASRIARANVHLVPNPNVPTSETGTRQRTAERVARSIDVPVISVSEELSLIAVYRGAVKHPLEAIPRLLARANQALQTLERYKARLDNVSGSLSALEVEDLVTVRDVVTVLQRAEMVRRIAEEIDSYIVELGEDGRLVRLQLEELMGGVEDDRRLVIQDYFRDDSHFQLERAMDTLAEYSTEDLLDLKMVVDVLHLPGTAALDVNIQPRGYRLLSKVPRLPDSLVERIIDRFGNLQKILRATISDLDDVEGVGDVRARAIRDGLSRLAETSILDRYS